MDGGVAIPRALGARHRRSLALALALVASAAAPASAAGPSDPPPVGFSLAPAGAQEYPKLRARPGGTARGAVVLTNHGPDAVRLRLRATDLGTAATGGPTYPDGDVTGVRRWIALGRGDVQLDAGGSARVPFTVRVPADARDGQHYGGIVAFDPAEARRADGSRGDALRLRHLTRLALPVRVTLPGPAAPALQVTGAGFAADAAGSRLDVTTRGSGNWLIRRTGVRVEVRRSGRLLFRHRDVLAEFVPGTTIAYPVPWRGRAAEGDYDVTVTLTPQGADPVTFTRTVGFGAAETERLEQASGEQAIAEDGPPLLLALLIAAAVAVAGLATIAWWRMRRQLQRVRTQQAGGRAAP